MVKFTLDLAVDSEQADIDAYNEIIEKIREQLAVGERIRGVPVLAAQVPAGGALEFFDLNLSYTDNGVTSTIRVRFRTDNLYLVGYRPIRSTPEESRIWYELGHEGGGRRFLINEPGTTTEPSGLGENYQDIENEAGVHLQDTPLSYTDIGQAIRSLAGRDIRLGERARAILTLTIATAEAARFRDISSLVSRSWWFASSLGDQFASRVRSWGRLSAAVQRTQNEGHTFDFDNGPLTGILDLSSAIRALGIMHLAYTASRPRRSTYDMAGALRSTYAQGQPLLEIFYVRINYIDGEDPGDLYGDVTVTDGVGTHSMWKREKHSPVKIRRGEDILLEGPWRALSAADEFYIHLDLWDYDYLSPDDSIAKGTIAFNSLDYFTEYDVFQNHLVAGKDGSVMVGYVAITDGLYAQITVILIDGDGEDPADVYGRITANNGYGQSELFRKANNEDIDVKPQHEIPLSRTVVAVPTTGTLRVNANLWDHEKLGGDNDIASGSVEFRPLYRRSEKKAITGPYGKIEVRVTWM